MLLMLGGFSRFIREKRGGIALIFALSALPLFGGIGVGVEFTVLMRARSVAQSAADAAVLAALAPSTPARERERAAQAAFLANLPANFLAMNPRLDVTITETDNVRTAHAIFAFDHDLYLAHFMGGPTTEVGGEAQASVAMDDYIDVDFWLDGSASMGVAADEAGRDRLRALSRFDPDHANCAFACHIPTRMNGGFATSEARAHANGVQLRFDVMKTNVLGLVDSLSAQADPDRRVRYSLNRLAVDFEVLLPLTDNERSVRSAINGFSLAPNGLAASMIGRNIKEGADRLPTSPGDGSRGRPRRVVVLVTDGMQFNWAAVRPGEIDPEVCRDVKETGAIMAVVKLRYVELDGDWAFEHYVRPHFNELAPALQACATSGYFFQGDTPEEIQRAFEELAMRLRESLRLTR